MNAGNCSRLMPLMNRASSPSHSAPISVTSSYSPDRPVVSMSRNKARSANSEYSRQASLDGKRGLKKPTSPPASASLEPTNQLRPGLDGYVRGAVLPRRSPEVGSSQGCLVPTAPVHVEGQRRADEQTCFEASGSPPIRVRADPMAHKSILVVDEKPEFMFLALISHLWASTRD